MADLDYAAWLRKEIARIEGGGACAPWLTKEQDLERLRAELRRQRHGAPTHRVGGAQPTETTGEKP